MLYGKLPIVFLSTIASEKQGSTNSVIAQYILENLESMRNMGIKEIAANCNVGISSISRFCREIGLDDFQELKSLLQTTDLNYEGYSENPDGRVRMTEFSRKIQSSLEMVSQSVSEEKLKELVADLQKYSKVASFGLMKAETAATILQSDLLMFEKYIYTNTSYSEQIQYIEKAGAETLLILFTYTGAYFTYETDSRNFLKRGNLPKIWIITGAVKEFPFYVSEVLTFESPQDYTSHPYQLDLMASLIGQEYAYQKKIGDSVESEPKKR